MNNNNQSWAQRPWVLAAFLAAAGVVLYWVTAEKAMAPESPQLQFALGAFISVAAMSVAFSLELVRWRWVLVFSLAWGLIIAFVAYSTVALLGGEIEFSFPLLSGLFAAGIALPLFQTIRKHGQLILPYRDLHASAWSDVVCWCASWAFVGLSFALAHLLASLFELVGIDLLKELLKKGWFIGLFIGASFGSALGILKENDRIIDSLQNLVMTILSILAPVLCLSLMLFLIVLPFTGLQGLWDATRNTTPILLSCAIGCITLTNAIIRNGSSEESSNRIMRYSAIILSACVLPIAVIAFISMLQRIEQYGLTPDRIWGLIATLVAAAYGIAYLLSLIRSGKNWPSNIRRNNTRLAILLCMTTLFLALPILNFTKMSVNSQLSRLDDKRVQADEFDYATFAFDLGEPGREALREMQSSDIKVLANGATRALAADNKWALREQINQTKSAELVVSKLVVFPQTKPIPASLEKAINKQDGCLGEYCILVWDQGTGEAQLLMPQCLVFSRYLHTQSEQNGYQYCPPTATLFRENKGKWEVNNRYNNRSLSATPEQVKEDSKAISAAIERGDIEIRTVERKQVFIGGKPVGEIY